MRIHKINSDKKYFEPLMTSGPDGLDGRHDKHLTTWTMCARNAWVDGLLATKQWSKVTCKRCLAKKGK